jgi:phosphoribosylaminoimidazole-succinocarboxamide synthase
MKKNLLYKGKSKSVYATEKASEVIIEYLDNVSAFNGTKVALLEDKGRVNNLFNAYMMEKITASGVKTHFIRTLSETGSLMKKLKMFPFECVVRNYSSGGICKRLGVEKGIRFKVPIFELFLKNDALGDPMVNYSHVLTFDWAKQGELDLIREITLDINRTLLKIFESSGFLLVDYKLEFGRFNDSIILGDEVSPDGMRLWDMNTLDSFDKDRFRQDMDDVIGHYKIVAARIGLTL